MPAPPTLRVRLLGGLDLRPARSPAAARLGPGRVAAGLPAAAPRRAAAPPAPRVPAVAGLDRAAGAHEPAPRAAQPAARAAGRRPVPRRRPAHAAVARRRAAGLDVAAFEAARSRDGDALGATRVDLYRGDLLEGCYDEWLLASASGCATATSTRSSASPRLLDERGERAEAIALRRAAARARPAARGDLPAADAAARRARRPGAGAAGLPRLRGDAGARAGRRAVGGHPRGLRGAAAAGRPAPRRRAGARPPLVGRAAERAAAGALLARRASRRRAAGARHRRAGIGKTRLVEELRAWCAHARRGHRRGALLRRPRAPGLRPARRWLRSAPLAARLRPARPRRTSPSWPGCCPSCSPTARPAAARAAAGERAAAAAVRRGRPGAARAPGRRCCWSPTTCSGADRETLRFLHYLLRAAAGGPAAGGRDRAARGARPAPPVSELVAGLQALGRLTEIALERLDRRGDRRARRAARRAAARRGRAPTGSTPRPRATRCSSSRRCGRPGRRRRRRARRCRR